MKVRDFMTALIMTAEEDTLVVDAAKLMAAEDIGSLLITKADVLAGMITRREVIGAQLLSEESFQSLRVEDIMTTPVVTIGPEADIGQAIALMNQTGKHHIPVIEGNDIIGLVAATDIIRVLATMKLIADGAPLGED
ncbi:MAG: Inosine-5'-monophosphate dehydrogenase [Candidatus Thorarchaeota archaeon AB_25]|nr:MAG: Inosine-5'-monophosphate dehydrogenase [Candidatus Thorarchaeota archaeon AB_25]